MSAFQTNAVRVAIGVMGILTVSAESSHSAEAAPSPPQPAPEARDPRRLPTRPAPPGTSQPPASVAMAALSSAHKEAILATANGLRSTLGAAAMPALTWDDNLATFAGNIAKTCAITHSTVQERTSIPGFVGTYVGENVAAASVSGLALADATNAAKVQGMLDQGIGMWWSEKANYDLATNTCKAGAVCGHYTQLAWSSTSKVGCAVSLCTPQKTLNASGFTLVCEFAAGGNVIGVKPYTLATPTH